MTHKITWWAMAISLTFHCQSYAQQTGLPPVSFDFLGFQVTEHKTTKIPVTLGVFRFTNNTESVMRYCDRYGVPDLIIRSLADGESRIVCWNWCANGSRIQEIQPKQSIYFYIDPEYHMSAHGAKLQFCIATSIDENRIPKLNWSEQLELPIIDNPPGIAQARFFTPQKQQTKDDIPQSEMTE